MRGRAVCSSGDLTLLAREAASPSLGGQAQCTLFMSGTLTLSLVGPFMVSVQLTGG